MHKGRITAFATSCAVVIILGGAGCSSTPTAGGPTARSDQELVELEKRYAGGAMSKEEYERQRADIHARAQRESLESGSPMNETIRGFRR